MGSEQKSGDIGRRRAATGGATAAGRRRSRPERALIRLVATTGIIGIGVAIGAILVSQKVHGWIVGLVVAVVTVVLSTILTSSRQL
jgi:hypothetical protein